jgi:membrane fusion protein, multidrug efflux system
MPTDPTRPIVSIRQRAATPAALLAALGVALGVAGCSRPEAAPEPVRAVRTITVSAGDVAASVEYAGEVRARTESRLGFRVAGKMTSRSAELGQRVKAGQLLASMDPQDLRLAQESALAAVRSAQVNADLAQADFQRYKDLREQGFIGAAELDRRETTLRAARAQLDQAKAGAAVQSNQAGYSQLLAPAAGVVTAIEAEPGAVLAAGTPVLRIAHDGPRDVVFAVPEDGVAAIRSLQGRAGVLAVRTWGSVTTTGAATLPATVREVAAAADPSTRTFLVKADVGGAAVQLGQTTTVLLPHGARGNAIRLPLAAVMQQQGRTSVWLLDRGTMTVKAQPIEVGGADGNSVLVAGGLSPGQTVVSAGVHVLTPGQKVKLYDSGTAAAAAATPAGR